MNNSSVEQAVLDLLSILPLINRRIRRKIIHLKTRDEKEESYIPHQHFEIVALLDEEGTMQMAEIGNKLLIAKAQMTQLMDKLSARNMIGREINPDDRRAVNVSLSAHGKYILEKNKTEFREVVKESMSDIPEKDLRELSTSLRKIQEILAVLK